MVTLGNITMYANDPRSLAHFWADVFGYPKMEWEDPLKQQLLDAGLTEDDLASRALAEDPEGKGPRFFFHHANGDKRGRNRLHLDINVGRDPDAPPHDHSRIDAEKDRLVGLGATVVRRIEQSWGPWPEYYYQMQDPEGNEFCLQ